MRDKFFRVELISRTEYPQQAIFKAMRQCYVEEFASDRFEDRYSTDIDDIAPFILDRKFGAMIEETAAGHECVSHLLSGNRGHYSPLEDPQIILNFGWFPHSVMQQVRTHRNVSFKVQSFRYSGKRILDAANGEKDIEEVFYLRPLDRYTDRQGKKYEYTTEMREEDLAWCLTAAKLYRDRIHQGLSEEHARGLIPFDVRQHWVMSANMRSLMHVLAIRGKPDCQLEIVQMCELILPHFQSWAPEIYEWFMENQWKKGRLAP